MRRKEPQHGHKRSSRAQLVRPPTHQSRQADVHMVRPAAAAAAAAAAPARRRQRRRAGACACAGRGAARGRKAQRGRVSFESSRNLHP